MTLTNWMVGALALGAVALGSLSASVQAAPLGLGLDGSKAAANENRAVENVVWVHRCWWRNGYRHCRRVWRDVPYAYDYDDGYYYGPSYYYGPGVGFSFGTSHRHHHHGGHGHR